MDIIDKYTVFESNQVLTSDQLNTLVNYLDQQNRLTRARLIGIGKICGFQLQYFPRDEQYEENTLLVKKGIGVTSHGFIINQENCYTTKYRPYVLPETVRYKPFEGENFSQDVTLYELLSSDMDTTGNPQVVNLTRSFLEDKAVILFLEIFDEDMKTCLAKSCDEIGQTRKFTLRNLLISTDDLDKIIERLDTVIESFDINSYDPTFPDKFDLPVISLPRITIAPDEILSEDDDLTLMEKYRDCIQPVIDPLITAIKQSYNIYEPILKSLYENEDYFDEEGTIDQIVNDWISYLTNETGDSPLYGMQYFYDLVKDLILAYEEFKVKAFELSNECKIELERFPQHLMLGLVIPPVGYNPDKTPYVNRFIHSPAYDRQKYLTSETKSLHKRLVSMILSFNPDYISSPDTGLTDIHILPSFEKLTSLSQRSIPFYYDPDNENIALINTWNYNFERRKISGQILSYHNLEDTDDPVKKPLVYDLDKFSFYRIEGILGQKYDEVLSSIEQKKRDFNLAFNIVALKLNPSTDTITIESKQWKDLQQLYFTARSLMLCTLQKITAYLKILEGYNFTLDYTTINASDVEVLVDEVKGTLTESLQAFNFHNYIDAYSRLLELLIGYKLAIQYYQGKLIHVFIQVWDAEDIQENLTLIDESLDFFQKIFSDCRYRELYLLYYRLIGRIEFLKQHHTSIFSNFIKEHPGIEHTGGVPKGGTYIIVFQDNNVTDGRDQVFADFSLPYLCCCECTKQPTPEEELALVEMPDITLPDGAETIINVNVDIDVLSNDYIRNTDNIDIYTDAERAVFDVSNKVIVYDPDTGFEGIDSFNYYVERLGQSSDGDGSGQNIRIKVVPGDLTGNELFGNAVDIYQDTAIIGAIRSSNAGCAYIYQFNNGQWGQQAKLIPSDIQAEDQFGYSVALQGNVAVIGSFAEDTGGNMAGSAYVFSRTGSTWTETQKLQPNDVRAGDFFGASVAIENNRIIIGAFGADNGGNNRGSVYVFEFSNNQWVQRQKLQVSDPEDGDYFGYKVAIHSNQIVVGAYCKDSNGYNAGSAYVFEYNSQTNQFIERQKLLSGDIQAGDYFGSAVDIYNDMIVIGARREDVPGTDSGSAYIFRKQNNLWVEQQKIQARDIQAGDYYGYAVGISDDTVVVSSRFEDSGGNNIGCAYLYKLENNTWSEITKLRSTGSAGDLFGTSVAIHNNRIIIGANKDDEGGNDAGSAYIFPADIEIFQTSAMVKVLVGRQYTPHIMARDDLEIIDQRGILVVDVLQNDLMYNTTELILPYTTSPKGAPIEIFVDTSDNNKEKIRYTPVEPGKDTFIYHLRDNTRNETSQAEVTVLVTKLEDTIPDINYLVTSPIINEITVEFAKHYNWKIGEYGQVPEEMGVVEVNDDKNGFLFTPGPGFRDMPMIHFTYSVEDVEGDILYGRVNLVNELDEVPDLNFQYKIYPSDGAEKDRFGHALDLYDNTLIVGSPGKIMDPEAYPGHAYLFIYQDNGWSELPLISEKASQAVEAYGSSVAIYRNTATVGGMRYDDGIFTGYMYFNFMRNGGPWHEIEPIERPLNREFYFGDSVDMYDYYLMIGAISPDNRLPKAGAYFYSRVPGSDKWDELDLIVDEELREGLPFENHVAIYGNNAMIGSCWDGKSDPTNDPPDPASNIGRVYMLELIDGRWSYNREGIIFPADQLPNLRFGCSVAIYEDTALIASIYHNEEEKIYSGTVYVYQRRNGRWALRQELVPARFESPEMIGYSLSIYDKTAAVSIFVDHDDESTGITEKIVVFEYTETAARYPWVEQQVLIPEDISGKNSFGRSLSLYKYRLIAGAGGDDTRFSDSGSAYVYNAYDEESGEVPKPVKDYINNMMSGTIAAFSFDANQLDDDWLERNGWLECNGQMISRTKYPKLFSRIGVLYGTGNADEDTFNVPDLRGEFIRGWAHDRANIDPERRIGTFQLDQLQGHRHVDAGHDHVDSGHNHSYFLPITPIPVLPSGGIQGLLYQSNNYYSTLSNSANIQQGNANISDPVNSEYGTVRYGEESRPRNYAFMYCIKT